MALTDIEKVRIEYGDTDITLPLLSNEEIQYFLDKNNSSIRLASIECARVALFALSRISDEQVSIFSIKGSKSAAEYREALKLFINNASLNPTFSTAQGYAAGISVSDMAIYTSDLDTTIRSFDF